MSNSSREPPSNPPDVRTEKFWTDLNAASARRQDPRVHANVPVSLRHANGAGIETRSNDLSYHGMQVWCDRGSAAKLRPRSKVKEKHPIYATTLQLDIGGVSHSVGARARIAHVTPIADAPPESAVAIGMAFVGFEDGAEEALHRFIDQHLQPPEWN